MREPGPLWPEFNPLRFPPCACPRCRDDEDGDGDRGNEAEAGGAAATARDAAVTDGEGAGAATGADGDSVLLRRLRERVAEENALRSSLRAASYPPAGA
ncbi:hypothetical protein [Streptomyces sp. NBC_01497]|uniref:hypothetical protein n=1 Tax=Streptomyces sp. NBC_01497 TaxID=2903885 RepID=UPI002E3253D1|nr:hypothetical protein [Streptomyces sp. NBC_01497]